MRQTTIEWESIFLINLNQASFRNGGNSNLVKAHSNERSRINLQCTSTDGCIPRGNSEPRSCCFSRQTDDTRFAWIPFTAIIYGRTKLSASSIPNKTTRESSDLSYEASTLFKVLFWSYDSALPRPPWQLFAKHSYLF